MHSTYRIVKQGHTQPGELVHDRDGRMYLILAVYQKDWSSLTIMPSTVDTCLVLSNGKVFEHELKVQQTV